MSGVAFDPYWEAPSPDTGAGETTTYRFGSVGQVCFFWDTCLMSRDWHVVKCALQKPKHYGNLKWYSCLLSSELMCFCYTGHPTVVVGFSYG